MSPLEAIAEKVNVGERLTGTDGQELASTADLIGLGMLAEEARRHRHADRATFLRVAHVTPATAAEAGPFPAAAGEVRLEGAPESIDEAATAVRAVVSRAGRIPVSAFSLAELTELARRAGISLGACLARLKDAGLERVAKASVESAGFEMAFEAAANAGIAVDRVVFERAGEDWMDRIQGLVHFQDATSSVSICAPVPPRSQSTAPTTGYDDLKKIALARLLVDNIETIQIDWAHYGPKLAQVALTFGADDLDDVPAVDDTSLGPRRTPLEDVQRHIRAASLVPVERNGRFELKI